LHSFESLSFSPFLSGVRVSQPGSISHDDDDDDDDDDNDDDTDDTDADSQDTPRPLYEFCEFVEYLFFADALCVFLCCMSCPHSVPQEFRKMRKHAAEWRCHAEELDSAQHVSFLFIYL
jgi:hypothetical protein